MFSTSKYIQALSVGIITMTLSSPQILTLQHFGFETFPCFFMVSVSVSKKIGIGKKFRIRFRSDFGFRHTLGLGRLGGLEIDGGTILI